MPNEVKMSREERQLIFHLRSRVTDAKITYSEMYDKFDCEVCKLQADMRKVIFLPQ